MLRIIRISSLLLLVLVAGIWGYAWVTKAPEETLGEAFGSRLASVFGRDATVPAATGGGLQMPGGISLGGPFELTDQTGKAVTDRDYAGRWLLVYFGFTYCPDVCPTELGTMASALDAMGAEGEAVTPMLITIDPERDTVAAMADYVSRFHPRMQGLTGTPEQISAVARRYRVYYARVQRPEMTDYLMDHSSFIYLVGPDGRVRSLFRPEMTPEQIATAVQGQIRGTVRQGS
ncbi:SCO family protein [Roseococcus pinisoli]|uniref:SCO family protein n=1 Tax=Roseococcus pinisoli TaxID=2835040 RepID=A0ABS5QEC6_9PROT|nr:SCO family protein [Roseococcus pinisoli]MBS7811280.1 SCO family protein [Roseococcus pinisoli]